MARNGRQLLLKKKGDPMEPMFTREELQLVMESVTDKLGETEIYLNQYQELEQIQAKIETLLASPDVK